MKKIDFTALKIKLSLNKEAKYIATDVSKLVGDAIYIHNHGIESKRLAEKIYDSTGEIDFSDEEFAFLIVCCVNARLANPLIEVIRGL